VGHVEVDQAAVAHDLALGGVDEPHPAHVGRELVDLVEGLAGRRAHGGLAGREVAQVDDVKVVGRGGRELGPLLVGAADPVAVPRQTLHEVAADEPARAPDERRLLPSAALAHGRRFLPSVRRCPPVTLSARPGRVNALREGRAAPRPQARAKSM
jgi:hypothetical protein